MRGTAKKTATSGASRTKASASSRRRGGVRSLAEDFSNVLAFDHVGFELREVRAESVACRNDAHELAILNYGHVTKAAFVHHMQCRAQRSVCGYRLRSRRHYLIELRVIRIGVRSQNTKDGISLCKDPRKLLPFHHQERADVFLLHERRGLAYSHRRWSVQKMLVADDFLDRAERHGAFLQRCLPTCA